MSLAVQPRKPPTQLAPLVGRTWAVQLETLAGLMEVLANRRDPVEFFGQFGQSPDGAIATSRGPVAVIPICGFISERASPWDKYFGTTSVEAIREAFNAAMGNQSVTAVVFDVDSPGGTVTGITELAKEIRQARGRGKRIVAISRSLCASAAYWIVAQCDEVVATPSSSTGSIGIYAVHQEYSRFLDEAGIGTTIISAGPHKTDGNEYEPLTDEAKAYLQERADAFYDSFVGDVAVGRKVNASVVKSDFGEGRVLLAPQALAVGMVDFVDTLDNTLRRTEKIAARAAGVRAQEEVPDMATAAAKPVETAADPETDPEVASTTEPFSVRLGFVAEETTALVEHATKRAELRAKEGRPALSESQIASARATRVAIDDLLALADPAPGASAMAVDPPKPPAVQPPPPSAQPQAATPARRFRDDAEWQAYLKGDHR